MSARPRPSIRRGSSLIELIAVLPAYAVITGMVGAALIIVTRSATIVPGGNVKAGETAGVVRRLADDFAEAIAVTAIGPTKLEFTVPDRTGNGREDRLRYEWSGTNGDPLLFTLNRQPPVEVLADVTSFALDAELESAVASPLAEELALIKVHDRAPDGHTHDESVETNKWCAQYFEPDLPFGTSSWRLKRVRFMAKRDGGVDGVLAVRIETAGPVQSPTGIVLDEGRVYESDLDEEPGWVEVDFTALNDLDPNEGLCLVIARAGGSDKVAKIVYEHGGDPMTAWTHWLKSGDAGVSWSDPVADKDMRFYIEGTYENFVTVGKQHLVGVRIRLGAGTGGTAAAQLTAPLLCPLKVAAP